MYCAQPHTKQASLKEAQRIPEEVTPSLWYSAELHRLVRAQVCVCMCTRTYTYAYTCTHVRALI